MTRIKSYRNMREIHELDNNLDKLEKERRNFERMKVEYWALHNLKSVHIERRNQMNLDELHKKYRRIRENTERWI